MLHIGLQSQYVMSVEGFLITNTFFTSVVVTILLAIFAVVYYLQCSKPKSILVKAMQALMLEMLKFMDMVTGDRKLSKRVLPLVATFFIFIITANLLGLLPGFLGSFFVQTTFAQIPLFKSPNSDLTTTLALALISVISIQYFSLSILGAKKYLERFFDFESPLKFVTGFFEMLSESVKIISFSFRLFGNIFAGEVLLIVVAFLVPYILPTTFMALEVFVGVIQAFIFAALTLVFIQSGTARFAGS